MRVVSVGGYKTLAAEVISVQPFSSAFPQGRKHNIYYLGNILSGQRLIEYYLVQSVQNSGGKLFQKLGYIFFGFRGYFAEAVDTFKYKCSKVGCHNDGVLKSTVRPCESVILPSSSTCNKILNTSWCAFSISSKR